MQRSDNSPDPNDRDHIRADRQPKSLLIMLAVIAVILFIVMYFMFSWYEDEDEATDPEAITFAPLIENARAYPGESIAA